MSASRRELNAQLAGGTDVSKVADDLFAIADLLTGNGALRRALSDPSKEGVDKARAAQGLLEGKVSPEANTVLQRAVAQRWNSDRDLVQAIEDLAVETVLARSESAGGLQQVEDELFQYKRLVNENSELRVAMTDRRASAQAKGDLAERILAGKARPETIWLARRCVSAPLGMRFDHALERYTSIAAERQQQLTATVTSATPLDEGQRTRLTASLSKMYGRAVHTNTIVDPEVVGGLRVEIGGEVIDGTIQRKLADAGRRIAAG